MYNKIVLFDFAFIDETVYEGVYYMVVEKKYTRSEICIGMKVRASQLSEIFDTYIILSDVKLVKDQMGIGTVEGIIDAISNTELRLTKSKSTLIYNDSYDKEVYCEYE